MSKKKASIPDAWDDDWENQVDTQSQEAAPTPTKKISQAQRRAQQAEFNRQLWEEAEAPKTFHFLDARQNTVPLKSDFKPAMTVLSRKPNQGNTASRQASSNLNTLGVENLKLDEDDYNSDEGTAPKPTLTPEQRRVQMQREHEEKQRKYEEARGRLFGTSSPGSGTSSPGNVTSREGSANKGKGKTKGGGNIREDSGRGSPGKLKQLYEPSYSPKPDSTYLAKRNRGGKHDDESDICYPIRQPRQPDGTPGFAAPHGR